MRWVFSFKLDRNSSISLTAQIAEAIASEVRRGRLRARSPLPGSRTLAEMLGVSRNTVFAAYEELAAEGWITSNRSGTFISESLPEPRSRRTRATTVRNSRVGFDLNPLAISRFDERELPKRTLRWDFGVPDARLVPSTAIARAYRRVLRRHGDEVLQYDRYFTTERSPLERAIAEMLSETRGLAVGPENVLITRGSQMALYLLAQALVRPGDLVAFEHPGYQSAWELFRRAGAELAFISVDREGVRVDEIRRLCENRRLRAIFLTPHHQFPTTVTLSIGRRLELAQLAAQARFAIIEDDFDHEFHFDGRPVAPMASADRDGVVVYVGSLSKILAPGLRVGFLVGPPALIQQARELRELIDVQGDRPLDWALADLFEEGEIHRHLGRARRLYRSRRDALADLLTRHLGGVLRFEVPSGGMAIWAEVDSSIDVERWADRALKHGLFFRTGSLFFAERDAKPFVRLGFARWNEQELSAAVAKMVQALPKAIGR